MDTKEGSRAHIHKKLLIAGRSGYHACTLTWGLLYIRSLVRVRSLLERVRVVGDGRVGRRKPAMLVGARVQRRVITKVALSEGERGPKPWLACGARKTAGCRSTAAAPPR
eukprot:scaffold43547_cov60-Phaeocystis_antarctica.AAC.2